MKTAMSKEYANLEFTDCGKFRRGYIKQFFEFGCLDKMRKGEYKGALIPNNTILKKAYDDGYRHGVYVANIIDSMKKNDLPGEIK